MLYGFMGKILRVNLTEGIVSEEDTREEWAEKFLGGAGLATKYLYDEVPKGAAPLGPENLLIFMAGPLTGTASPSASRYSVVAKSPLTGIWGHGNSGGSFGPALKKSGYDGIIIRLGEGFKTVAHSEVGLDSRVMVEAGCRSGEYGSAATGSSVLASPPAPAR